MMSNKIFSVIIPMYNAEITIAKSIESVINQTFDSWELIIVDDCSSDGSAGICRSYEAQFPEYDIRLISLSENSGNAKMPRDMGVKNAKGDFCVFLDSDDVLAADYLEKISMFADSGADVVLPVTVRIKQESGTEVGRVPSVIVDRNLRMSGYNACKLTIPEWKIGCGGMAFCKKLYDYVIALNDYHYAYSDELSERIILYYAESVAFSDAEYFYMQHSQSITHKPSRKLCEILPVDVQIIDFVKKRYDSELLRQTERKFLSRLIMLQKRYIKNRKLFNRADWIYINDIIQKNYNKADWRKANMGVVKSFLYSRGFFFFKSICFCSSIADIVMQKCFSR